jgi:xanthine dehydrogenase accessory factor
VGPGGQAVGSFPVAISDACVTAAQEVLDGALPRLVVDGSFSVWVARWEGGRFGEIGLAGGRAAQVTLLSGARPGASLVIEPDGLRTGTLGAPELDDEAARLGSELMWQEISERRGTMFIDVLVPPPRLLVFGAGEIARCLSRVGRAVGWEVCVIDREAAAEDVVVGEPAEAVERLGGIDRATSIVVISHDHDFGVAALALALRSPARFIGAMGSRRTQAARMERLVALGFDGGELERLSAPVGLDLGAVEPSETALSVLAEAVAVRHGRAGGRLAARVGGGSIHEVAR